MTDQSSRLTFTGEDRSELDRTPGELVEDARRVLETRRRPPSVLRATAAVLQFTAEDEELVTALAATAGSAIDDARLYHETQLRQRWSAALAEVTTALLSDPPRTPLHLIVSNVLTLTDAVLVGLVREASPETMLVDVAEGPVGADLAGLVFRSAGTLPAAAIDSGHPVVVPSSDGTRERPLVLGPTMVIPMPASRYPRRALIVSRAAGGPPFTDPEVRSVTEFAAQAGAALELAAAREDQRRQLVLEDRGRIARDLHDHVIQRLFAAGLNLQGAAGQVADSRTRERITAQVRLIDEAIAAIRSAVFTLESNTDDRMPLRVRVLELLAEVADVFPVAPALSIAGSIELPLPPELADDLLAALREGLTNVARHAHADHVSVRLTVDSRDVTLEIADDGVGTAGWAPRSGLANLERRAVRHGGGLRLVQRRHGGTLLTWSASLRTDIAEGPDDPGIPAR
jgi:signal transduction histidine kinase